MMEKSYDYLKDNIDYIREKINTSAKKVNRNPSDITLLGVTKTVPSDIILKGIEYGITEIGENRVQEMISKYDELSSIKHTTHIIGHLQTNKVKYLPSKVAMIQSVDSDKLASKINDEYTKSGEKVDVLIEINIGAQESKSGISPDELSKLIFHIEKCKALRLRGLMTVPPICENDEIRKYFENMYKLFIDIQRQKSDNICIDTLSMGMSDDFEYAIEEGATMVRVGSAIFGKRNYK